MQHNDIRLTAGAHTIAYRNIELAVAENTNDEEQGVENNDSNMGIYQSNISESFYDSLYTMASNTGVLEGAVLLEETEQTNNIRPLVVVTVRGSVTFGDWMNNVLTQLYPLDNKFDDLKDTVEEKLTSFVPNLSDSIILITGHSFGAVIANLFAAQRYPTYRRCSYYSIP